MREGHSTVKALRQLGFGLVLTAALSFAAVAQGGDGRSDSVRLPSASDDNTRRPGRSPRRPSHTERYPAAKVHLPETGRVSIHVNGGGSQLRIFREGIANPEETVAVPDRTSSLIIRTLEVGSYTIAVKKPGFHDEVRTVEIDKGGRRRVEINLRPKMATLSVASNLPDAKIRIDKLGEFDRPVVKALVNPGSYRVYVSRRGFVSRQLDVRLKTAGSAETLNVILEPLRIDSVLEAAQRNINAKDYAEAEDLLLDVLALNADHGRANLLFGLLDLDRGKIFTSTEHLLKGIRGGETLTFPIRVQANSLEETVSSVEFIIDRNAFRIKSTKTPGLNFSIAKADAQVSQTFNSDDRSTFVMIWGKSNFHGREIEPQLRVFSPISSGNASAIDCPVSTADRSCRSDIEILRGLISAWRQ
jgi:hypothetical protein